MFTYITILCQIAFLSTSFATFLLMSASMPKFVQELSWAIFRLGIAWTLSTDSGWTTLLDYSEEALWHWKQVYIFTNV